MSVQDYTEALKAGKKEYKSNIAHGKFPYLPVLDEIISQDELAGEVPLGLVTVPLDFVVGTATTGRTHAFASNFMPILDLSTEFAYKWAALADAQVTEGIRDPIIAYEYMNRYYVVEGNKRVSVLKHFGAVSVHATVTRKMPKLTDDEDVRLYYELIEFNRISGYNSIEFTKLGNARRLIEQVGAEGVWDDETRDAFSRILFHFTKAFEFNNGKKLPITAGDALVAFLNVYGYETAAEFAPTDYNDKVTKAWNEIVMMREQDKVDLVMDPKDVPTQDKKPPLLPFFLSSAPKKYKVAFLYPRSADSSDWVYAHELGRIHLDENFGDQMETYSVSNVTQDNIEQVLTECIENGTDIIFEIAPQHMTQSLKVAVDHPEVKILNCSLNTPHQYIRTYYARMYEAKFVSGMIAGAMADNDKVAYIADYPIYGMIANINAFALGAACTNPRVKVYLEWSTKKDYDRDRFLTENDIHYVSDQDMITPTDASRQYGLYQYRDGVTQNLVMPLWNWGVFYERLIQSIMAGAYQSEGGSADKALNYWWGISAGVIDLICSNHIPTGVRRMADHIKHDISTGDVAPFYGEILAQDGSVKNKERQEMKPEDIMQMDWLVENVIGTLPAIGELVEGAKPVVEEKGVEEIKTEETT
jgi:basic membrane lipoprotein Med (substrate-binding protein (PBP1-ABC) superfamily)